MGVVGQHEVPNGAEQRVEPVSAGRRASERAKPCGEMRPTARLYSVTALLGMSGMGGKRTLVKQCADQCLYKWPAAFGGVHILRGGGGPVSSVLLGRAVFR
jgi:hypothetical protein